MVGVENLVNFSSRNYLRERHSVRLMGFIRVLFFDRNQRDLDHFVQEQGSYVAQRGTDSSRLIVTAKSLDEVKALDFSRDNIHVGFFDAYEGACYRPEAFEALQWVRNNHPAYPQQRHLPLLYLLVAAGASNVPSDVYSARQSAVISGILSKNLDVVQRMNDVMYNLEFPQG